METARKNWNEEEIEYLEEMMKETTMDAETIKSIAEELNRTVTSVKWKILMLKRGKRTFATKIYAVYKGEDLLVIGTAEECAEHLGVKPEYIGWLTTPSGKARQANRKRPENATVAEII